MDLIFAEATPPGRGGVSVIRLSGDGARQMVERFVGPLPVPRHAYFRALSHEDEPIDQTLAIWFEDGASFTGEETAELHLHGAPIIAKRVSVILQNSGARPAEAGEFTRRAFLNGKMDLVEIEGLNDLLSAETEAQRKLAIRATSGELARKAENWRALLIEAGALVEVSVDFADEDVPDEVPDRVFYLIKHLKESLAMEISGFSAAERIREGFEVAIVGPANAGKSSLFNRLARRDVAIVSARAGTTRDVLEVKLDLRGLAVTVLDTAGLRMPGDEIEAMGITRARNRAEAADLRIHLSEDGTTIEDLWRSGDILVRGKADLHNNYGSLSISATTGNGVDQLLAELFDRLSKRISGAGLISHERQRLELVDAADALAEVNDAPPELIAESLRRASASLDRLVGKIGAEDYLDAIFSSFCIGK